MPDLTTTALVTAQRPRARRVSRRGRRRLTAVVCGILLIGVMAFFLAPFLWMFVFSVYPSSALQGRTPDLSPSNLTVQSYIQLLSDGTFLIPMANSAIVGLSTTIICMTVGAACAYAIARFRFRGRQPLLLSMMTVQAIPVIVLAVPLFILLRSVGLYDQILGLIATYTAFILPLVIWMLVGFFEDIPPSLERAARIDGCNRLQIMYRIAFPLAAPGMAATAILAFITSWSDFFLAKVLTSNNAVTLPVKTAAFQGLFAMDYTSAATAGVITAIPVLILTLVAQKWIIRGMTEGAVKG
ncbi:MULTISPECIES: carbohydrate ABC transporter permease [unclassified Microbacterium]|uniref:carbohydrate ABC transporter permease n=1 Tax=unclassified Microbacterium TaxID=2609290 RepID=UPI0016050433|nr:MULTISPECIES: carbohydrate ABC transporter permease [unclassified Microbacterium]QNA91600.1 carbohydrate ABC transporter permease [Microbacterium sp. Se63.02b]QYM64778.1 carbohydrate ABC transporter permease [Microbacterium sp. Se5.02b]